MSDVVYLYGFVPAITALDGAPAGIDDRAVEAIELDGAHALVSRLPADDYAAAALDTRMEDLGWVAARGLAHERVVAWFVDHGEIVPAPLFTLFSSVAALKADAGRRAAHIRQTLERFAGLREWDVKLGYRAEQLAQQAGEVSDEVRALDDEIAAATPGKRFLLERKRADLAKREVVHAARRIADELFDELRAHAHDAVRLALPGGAAELPVVLSAALLIDRAGEAGLVERLETRARALHPLGVELSFSGPWAAYRFMGAPATGAPDAVPDEGAPAAPDGRRPANEGVSDAG